MLRCRVAEELGFPTTVMSFVLPSGVPLQPGILAAQPSFVEAVALDDPGAVSLTCVVSSARPCGKKQPEHWRCCPVLGAKAGFILETLLEDGPRSKELLTFVQTLRTPKDRPESRLFAQQLITTNFASHLDDLIDAAFSVVYSDLDSDVALTFTHEPTQAALDLSTCQLWLRVFDMQALRADDGHGNMWMDALDRLCGDTLSAGILGGVLWRVLEGWHGMDAAADFAAVPAGPVLEVLFLATVTEFRRGGEAAALLKDLEAGAKAMGFVAIAVAAVPQQGMNFWTKKMSYSSVVALNPSPSSASDVFCEPTNELGRFLFENMMLFDDTPLVAKSLASP
eukprot:TRINITY_DN11123_c0_g1_i16.p1 TRINITY_DN11123_c0_g1~~TRINITY_DN11123_c0_g1_i16.p1  ORF type:complete len:338 (-),score=67.09 TRINITY_DN11123_c0_g1_i16:164-1177(-)